MSDTQGSDPGERKFLHDIASPLATGIMILEALLEQMQAEPGLRPEWLQRLGKVQHSLDRIHSILTDRRTLLIASEVKDAQSK